MTNVETIVEMKFGSHLYGTNTPASDLDFKAVHIPTARQLILDNPQKYDVITKNTKNGSLEKNTADDVDHESYSLKKFLKLASEGQTVAMDILFCPANMLLTPPHPIWETIRSNKHRITTSKAASFIGYCRTQANKYGIKGSRMNTAEALANLLAEKMDIYGTTTKLAEIRPDLEAFVKAHEHCGLIEIDQNTLGVTNKMWHLESTNRKCPLTFTLKNAHQIYSNIFNEYGKRARAAKDNQGIDWKALSHAVRVGRECIELLKTGGIVFPRPEAAHLIQIKTGQLGYDQVAEEIEQILVDAEEASAISPLRVEPDFEWIDDLIYEVYRNRVISDC